MDISVVLVVLGAAFLHAFWNFQVRSTEDKALGMAAVMFGHLPLAIIGLARYYLLRGLPCFCQCSFAPRLSGVSVNAYRFGELTQIYSVARGAYLTGLLFYYGYGSGVLKTTEVIGVILVSGAIITYGIAIPRQICCFISILAVITGCFNAGVIHQDATGTLDYAE